MPLWIFNPNARGRRAARFTINALYADRHGKIYDPLGTGKDDLAQKRVTFIGSANERIREDYLRILRFFRFSAIYADQTKDLIQKHFRLSRTIWTVWTDYQKSGLAPKCANYYLHPTQRPPSRQCVIGALMRVLEGADDRSLALLVHLESECDAHIQIGYDDWLFWGPLMRG